MLCCAEAQQGRKVVILGSGSLALPYGKYHRKGTPFTTPALEGLSGDKISFLPPYCLEASAVSVSEIRTEKLGFLPLAVDFYFGGLSFSPFCVVKGEPFGEEHSSEPSPAH